MSPQRLQPAGQGGEERGMPLVSNVKRVREKEKLLGKEKSLFGEVPSEGEQGNGTTAQGTELSHQGKTTADV